MYGFAPLPAVQSRTESQNGADFSLRVLPDDQIWHTLGALIRDLAKSLPPRGRRSGLMPA